MSTCTRVQGTQRTRAFRSVISSRTCHLAYCRDNARTFGGAGLLGIVAAGVGLGLSVTPAAPLGWAMIGGGTSMVVVGGLISWWEEGMAAGV